MADPDCPPGRDTCFVNIVGPHRTPWLIFGWQRGNPSPPKRELGPERDRTVLKVARPGGEPPRVGWSRLVLGPGEALQSLKD
jgi:hypothetical protein